MSTLFKYQLVIFDPSLHRYIEATEETETFIQAIYNDLDAFLHRHCAEQFFRKICGFIIALYEAQTWIRPQVFQFQRGTVRKGMILAQKYMRRNAEQLRKLQVILFQKLSQNTLIFTAHIEDPYITESIAYILKNLMGLRFIQDKFEPFLSKLLNQLHESICGKGIVLGGNAKPLSGGSLLIYFASSSSIC